MLRVLIFAYLDMRVGGGSSIRSRLLAKGLHEQGAAVGVMSLGIPDELIEQGVEFHPIPADQCLDKALVDAGNSFESDVLYGITEAFANVVVKASQTLKCPCAFDLHGIGIFEILELGRGHGNRLRRLRNSFRWLASMRKASAITLANPTLLAPAKRFINPKAYLNIGAVDTSHFEPEGAAIEIGSPGHIHVLYAGNFLKWQGGNLLLDAAQSMVKEKLPYDFTFIGSLGSNANKNTARTLVESGQAEFRDPVSYEQIPGYLRGGDILVIPRPFMLSTYFAFPGKISDYMAVGRAILATDIRPHRYVFTDGYNAVLCKPSSDDIVNGLLRLKEETVRRTLGQNARIYAEQNLSYTLKVHTAYEILRSIQL